MTTKSNPSTGTARKNTSAAPSRAPSTTRSTRTTKPAVSPRSAKTPTSVKKTAAAPAKTTNESPAKEKKVKVVRDSFTIPKNEFTQIGDMKKKALAQGLEVKKSELIRAGLMVLSSMSDAAFKKAISSVPTLKTGRPGKN